MKLTLEPTTKGLEYYSKVSIELPGDDLSFEDVVNHLLRPALIGWGFAIETVDKYLGTE